MRGFPICYRLVRTRESRGNFSRPWRHCARMRNSMTFLIFFLAVCWLSWQTLTPNHPPGGVAALPLPPLEKAQTQDFETATFALG